MARRINSFKLRFRYCEQLKKFGLEIEKDEEKYYRMGVGGFKCSIHDNILEITAWEISATGKEWKLEQKSKLNELNSIHGAEYKKILYALFKDIEELNVNTEAIQSNQEVIINNNKQEENKDMLKNTNETINKRNEILCILAFIASIGILLYSIFEPEHASIIPTIFIILFAALGLNTTKKKLAISAIILTILSIIIRIVF